MSLLDSPILGDTGYSFSQQEKDFIKLQFKYGLILKNRLAAGNLPGIDPVDGAVIPNVLGPTSDEQQTYYNLHLWLTTQTLTAPYTGWWQEFKTAIESEDLDWLLKQVGGTKDELISYMGSALKFVAHTAGQLVGTAISSTSTGLLGGFFGSLNLAGWLVVGGIGLTVYYGWRKGYIQRVFGHELKKLIP